MAILLILAVAAAQAEMAQPLPQPSVQCPSVALAAMPPREVTLQASDIENWRGPVIELSIAVTGDEAQAFGKLAFIRVAGSPLAGGRLERPVDEKGVISFRLAFTPDQLAILAQGGTLELVERGGPGLKLSLSPADAAPLVTCLAESPQPFAPANAPFMQRSWTFVPLLPNQPVSIRSRGNPSFDYPPKALSEAREGTSRVGVTIGTDGRIDDCVVIVSSGHADLDAASCRVARRSTYLPATDANGEPVEFKAEQNLVWKMGE